jgi:hypothetical protein
VKYLFSKLLGCPIEEVDISHGEVTLTSPLVPP